MLAESAFCRSLALRVGTDDSLAVAELSNGQPIRETTSIPTASSAMKRFEVAVLSATKEWTEGGLLTPMHVGMILPQVPANLEEAIEKVVNEYSFTDPWSGAGLITLNVNSALLNLGGFVSVHDALARAEGKLQELDAANPSPVRRDLARRCDDEVPP